MSRRCAAWLIAAVIAAPAPAHAQIASPGTTAADSNAPITTLSGIPVDTLDRVRARLNRPPSKLVLQDRTPDFTVHIEKRRPMQDIFDTPPWQLPPLGWQPPTWSTGFNLMSLVSYVSHGIADAKRGHDERVAREDVQRSIADWCAAQENHGAYIIICPQR